MKVTYQSQFITLLLSCETFLYLGLTRSLMMQNILQFYSQSVEVQYCKVVKIVMRYLGKFLYL